MRKTLIGLALVLGTLPAWALTRIENEVNCTGSNTDLKISGCTALIQSGGSTANLAAEYYNRANAYYDKGLYKQSIADYTKTLAITPNDPDSYGNRAGAYLMAGDTADALADAKKAVALAPTANNVLIRAEVYQKLGQRDLAIADFRAALKIDPKSNVAEQRLKELGAAPS
jgi:tetratricopeptide (TPR) repeat protein